MLQAIKKIEEGQSIEYSKISTFENDYKSDDPVPHALYTKVISLFFTKLAEYILVGNTAHLPIGSFYIRRANLKSTGTQVSHAMTRKLRRDTGDPNIVAYRTADHFFMFHWQPPAMMIQFKRYRFKAARTISRKITSYLDILELNVI